MFEMLTKAHKLTLVQHSIYGGRINVLAMLALMTAPAMRTWIAVQSSQYTLPWWLSSDGALEGKKAAGMVGITQRKGSSLLEAGRGW